MKSLRAILLLSVLIISVTVGHGQQTQAIKELLDHPQSDTIRVRLLSQLASTYYFSNPDSCLFYAREAIDLAGKLNFPAGETSALNAAGEAFHFMGDFPQSLEMQFKALQINRSTGDKSGEAKTMDLIGIIYIELSEFRQGLSYLYIADRMYDSFPNPTIKSFNLSNIGNVYEKMNLLDSALFFQQLARTKSTELSSGSLKSLISSRLGIVLARMGKHAQALQYYHNSIQYAYSVGDKINPTRSMTRMAESHLALGQKDSAFYYARMAFASGEQLSQKLQKRDASNVLIKLFRNNHMPDSVIHYQDISIALNDSLFGPAKLKQLQLFALNEQQRQQEILQEQERYKNKVRTFALLAILGFFLIIAIILFRNNHQKHKVNLLLQDQKNEIQQTLTILKSTQNQLIQREKMASLGELTSGIAHEIQNPLNFVNNFSEVNKELIDEMKDEIDKGNMIEIKKIADEISDNEKKITNHGKRADMIVKSMLQHSRSSTGVKELTDINALADEYLRLSYNGIRASDKSFNAKTQTDFDNNLSAGQAGAGKINIASPDIGRVLLNVYNNAFYAVTEKRNASPFAEATADGDSVNSDYHPTVTVSTKRSADKILISVRDNGNGIALKVLDKIFQPFFTTKPPGKGTGLGLSLSYDIIKAHGGEIKVETKSGEFTEFIISLPS